jgi:carboxymethylenebutenolidase
VLAHDLNFGRVAATIEAAEQLMEKRDFERMQATALDAIRLLRSQPGVKPGKLGAVGFSMGASSALVLSTELPEEFGAVSLFYGAEGVDFSKAGAAYQGHFGETDEWTELKWAHQMEGDLHAAGLKTEFHVYPGVGHWFIEEDRPDAYQPEAARLAWDRTVQFLKTQLGA